MKSYLLVSSVLLGGALGATACSATMDSSTEPKVVGEQAELVARKKEWLKAYDADCEVCFKAFDQCQLGALDATEEDACQIALDACVRGGMIDDDEDDDGGAAGGDDDDGSNNGDVDVDAGEVADGGASEPDDDGDSNDAGVDNDDDDDDDGDAEQDAGVDEDDDDGGVTGGDPGKKALLEAVRECVSDARDCTDAADADARACLSTLRACVKEVLSSSFEGVCNDQIARCDRDNAPREARRSVAQLCEGGLQ